MNRKVDLYSRNLRLARTIFSVGKQKILLESLEHLSAMHFEIGSGDLVLLNNYWYVTHTGLLRMAKRKRCSGMEVEAVVNLCDSDWRRILCFPILNIVLVSRKFREYKSTFLFLSLSSCTYKDFN